MLIQAEPFVDELMSEAQHMVSEFRYVEGDYSLVDLQIGNDLDVEDIFGLEEGRQFMKVTVECTATVDGFMFKSDYYALGDDARVIVMDGDWNDHYMWVEFVTEAHLTLNITFDLETNEVDEIEVETFSSPEPNWEALPDEDAKAVVDGDCNSTSA